MTFLVCRPGDDVVLEEVREFQTTVLVATLTGFLLGGLVGARYAGDKFVAISHSSKFSSTMQAQVCTACMYRVRLLQLHYVCVYIKYMCVYKTETKSCQNNSKPIMYFHRRLLNIYMYIHANTNGYKCTAFSMYMIISMWYVAWCLSESCTVLHSWDSSGMGVGGAGSWEFLQGYSGMPRHIPDHVVVYNLLVYLHIALHEYRYHTNVFTKLFQ